MERDELSPDCCRVVGFVMFFPPSSVVVAKVTVSYDYS